DLLSPRPLMVMADVFSILGRYETALEYASRAEAAGYPMDEAALIKGICLMMTGRFDEALSELDRVPSRSDFVGKALSNRCVCCWLKRDYRGAARSISALAISGESPEAVRVYRQLQSRLHQGRRPRRPGRNAAHPAGRRAVMGILQKFLALGRDEEMRFALSLLDVDDLATQKELAHLYYRHEKLELASAELVRAIDNTGPLPELLALLGEVEARRRSNRAAEILARAVEADPPGVVAYVMLARLYRSEADEIETAADASPAEGVSRE
ncbi:MAG: tetratricopeptide repeat protein, partial [Actinobacteria bacterium]|nr:tetratricopeptide repeat protein [Actinomycetota bacterium]